MKRAPTPETDEEHQRMPMGGFTLDFARKLERERDAAIAERDEAVRSCYIWQKGHAELVKERDKWAGLCDNALSDWRQADTDSIRALHERNKAREQRDEARQQRDRLAEALEDIRARCQDKTIKLHPDSDAKGCVDDCLEWSEQALQSLTNQPK